jgi:hypothetical protein
VSGKSSVCSDRVDLGERHRRLQSDEEVEESATGGAPRGVELPQQGTELPTLVLLLVAQNNLLRVQREGAVDLKNYTQTMVSDFAFSVY